MLSPEGLRLISGLQPTSILSAMPSPLSLSDSTAFLDTFRAIFNYNFRELGCRLKFKQKKYRSTAMPLVRLNGLLQPGKRKVYMFRIEEEGINIVIGEALLALLDDDAEVSTEKLSAQLKRMLKTETSDARRQAIQDAIRQTGGFLHSAGEGQYDAVKGKTAYGRGTSGPFISH
jgi:hypothetical protein